MNTIKSATYGNDTSSTDVTNWLLNQFAQGGQYVEVTAGPGVVGTQTMTGTTVELTPSEEDEVTEQAEITCGNAVDRDCMELQVQALRDSKLAEKARSQAVNPVTGDRLTVTVIENGQEKTIVVPKDQVFRFGTPPEGIPSLSAALEPLTNVFTVEFLTKAAWAALYYFIWAFGTALTWIALSETYQLPTGHVIRPGDYWWLKYIGTIIALLSGGWGGFVVIVIVYFVLGLKHYIGQRSLLASTQ